MIDRGQFVLLDRRGRASQPFAAVDESGNFVLPASVNRVNIDVGAWRRPDYIVHAEKDPGLLVIQIEPIPKFCRMIRTNATRSPASSRIWTLCAAIGTQQFGSHASFHLSSYLDAQCASLRAFRVEAGLNGVEKACVNESRRITVPVVPLIVLLERLTKPVTWLKIDAQGTDLDVALSGGHQLWRKVRQLELEMQDVEAGAKIIMYEGAPLLSDVVPAMCTLGFQIQGCVWNNWWVKEKNCIFDRIRFPGDGRPPSHRRRGFLLSKEDRTRFARCSSAPPEAMATFSRVHGGACCPLSSRPLNQSSSAALRVARPCGCHTACMRDHACRYFSFDGSTGRCHACKSPTADCTVKASYALRRRQALRRLLHTSTWRRDDTMPTVASAAAAASAFENATAALECPARLLDHWRSTNRRYKPPTRGVVSNRHSRNRMSEFLGTNISGSKREARTSSWSLPVCTGSIQSEEAIFRATCAESISEYDAHLRRSAGSRVLLIESEGHSSWGWGNVLPVVYALHLLCVRSGRYCQLHMQDQDFGHTLGYANGERWQADVPELRRRFSREQTLEMNLSTAAWTYIACDEAAPVAADCARLREPSADFDRFAAWLRNDDHALVHLRLTRDAASDPYRGFWSWLPYSLPLRAADRRLDRCFCRYVTHPIFLGSLPQDVASAVHTIETHPPSVVLHLRTMANHLPAHARSSSCEDGGSRGGWRRWFEASCDVQNFESNHSLHALLAASPPAKKRQRKAKEPPRQTAEGDPASSAGRDGRILLIGDSPRLLIGLQQAVRNTSVLDPRPP